MNEQVLGNQRSLKYTLENIVIETGVQTGGPDV